MKWVNRKTLTVVIGVIVAIIIIITSTSMIHPTTQDNDSSSVDMDASIRNIPTKKVDSFIQPLPELLNILYHQMTK